MIKIVFDLNFVRSVRIPHNQCGLSELVQLLEVIQIHGDHDHILFSNGDHDHILFSNFVMGMFTDKPYNHVHVVITRTGLNCTGFNRTF